MKTLYVVTLSMLAGAAFGAAAIQGLHAQAKPPVYQISEIDVTDQDAFMKDYLPKVQAVVKAAGDKSLAAGGKTTTIEGEPPKPRVVVTSWESVEKYKLTAIQRRSRPSCRSAIRWRHSAPSPSKVCRNNGHCPN